MKGLTQAERAIKGAETIAVAGHINPDGDSIGSLLSLGEGLRSLGKKVYMLSQDGVPKRYQQLPGAKKIKTSFNKRVDLAITVDCSAKDMLGGLFRGIRKSDTILEIDHHVIREPYGELRFIDAEAAAVGEMIYMLLRKLKVEITSNIAQNILTSLIVETNSFRLPNVRPFTFKVCTEMVKTGVDFYRLVDMVFWSHSKEVALLSGLAMSRCQFSQDGRLAWSIIKQNDLKKIKGKAEDVDAVADEIRAIKGVDIVLFFRENSNRRLRVSLRSKRGINIARLAEEYNGGGHSDVAGCVVPDNKKSINQIISKAKALLK